MKFAKSLVKIKIALLIGVGGCLFLTACETIVPHTVEATGASYSGGVRNSGIVKFVPGGAILDAHGVARYDALIEEYGSFFAPALKMDEGLVSNPDHTYLIDDEHLAKAVQMNLWRRSGKTPPKKGLLDKVIDAIK